jgi:hypothetical protein
MDVTSCLDELGLYAMLCPLRRLIGDVVGVRERPSYPGGVSLETKHHRKQNKVSQRNPRSPPALIAGLMALRSLLRKTPALGLRSPAGPLMGPGHAPSPAAATRYMSSHATTVSTSLLILVRFSSVPQTESVD